MGSVGCSSGYGSSPLQVVWATPMGQRLGASEVAPSSGAWGLSDRMREDPTLTAQRNAVCATKFPPGPHGPVQTLESDTGPPGSPLGSEVGGRDGMSETGTQDPLASRNP